MAPNSAQQHFTSADVSPSARRDFLMEIPYADAATTGTARRGVTSSQKQIIPASNAPTQSMAPQQYFTPASVSPNTRWDLLMKIPYADSATTLHSLTGCNIIATEADYPRKRRARLLEQYLPLCRCCPKRDGTLP